MARRATYLLIVLFMVALPAGAAFEMAIEVVQPLALEDAIVIAAVTFMEYRGHYPHGLEVDFTSRPSWVVTQLGDPENRNLANIHGLTAGADPYHSREQTLYGDTLKIYVDVSSLGESDSVGVWSSLGVVQATVEAALINAWRGREAFDRRTRARTAARFVVLEVRGSTCYRDLEGTYDESAISALPSRRAFH